MYGRHGADGGEPREVGVERVDLALERGAHRAPRAVHRHRGGAALLPVLRVFAEAGREDVLEPAARARLAGALVELVQVAALPEFVLERVGVPRRALQLEHLEEDLPPRPQRQEGEQQQHRLDDQRRLRDQREEGKIGVDVQAGPSSRSIEIDRDTRQAERGTVDAGERHARLGQAGSRRATPAAMRPSARGRVRSARASCRAGRRAARAGGTRFPRDGPRTRRPCSVSKDGELDAQRGKPLGARALHELR